MEKQPRSKRTIRFQDCDPFNHLNNARYIDYFINTREDQLTEHYGLDVFSQMKTTGKSWVVTSNQISYIKPAKTMETVIIDSKLIHFDEYRLRVEMRMWNEAETELKAVIWMTFTHVNVLTSNVEKHTDELSELFKSILVTVPVAPFDERVGTIVGAHKSRNYAKP